MAEGHETHDVSIKAIVGFGVGLIVAAAIIHAGIWLLFRFFESYAERRDAPPSALASRRPVEAPRNPDRFFPEPRLERFPFAAREQLRQEEDALLTGYGWVDERRGLARIPIDRAMELIAQRGIPPETGTAPPPSVPPGVGGTAGRPPKASPRLVGSAGSPALTSPAELRRDREIAPKRETAAVPPRGAGS